MDVIKYIQEDLKRSGINNYTYKFVNWNAGFMDEEVLKIDNGILYVFAIASMNNRPGTLESLEMIAQVSPSSGNKTVFKFHNDIYNISNVREFEAVKVKFTR